MENTDYDVTRYRTHITRWWLAILLGLFFFIMGIVVFFKPGDSYMALSVIFGIMVILSGIYEIYLGSNSRIQSGRGWLIAAGIVEVLLGTLLWSIPAMLFSVLPFVLGFWLMFRGFTAIGIASDMQDYGVRGAGWTMAIAILVIICAFFVLFNPIIGVGLAVFWLGASLILAGIDMMVHGAHLHRLQKQLR